MTAEDRQLIVDFLIDLRHDLHAALFDPIGLVAPAEDDAPTLAGFGGLPDDVRDRLGTSLVEPELAELYRTAWTENMDQRFDELISALQPTVADDSDPLGADEPGRFERLMVGAGLTGSELRMKLGGFRHLRFLDHLPGSKAAQEPAKRPLALRRWMARGLTRFDRQLSFGCVILGSLSAFVGVNAAEPVKEFVEAVQNGLRAE